MARFLHRLRWSGNTELRVQVGLAGADILVELCSGSVAAHHGRTPKPGRVEVKSSNIRAALCGLCVMSVLLAGGGCGNDENRTGRLVCEVVSVNGGNPLMSAFVTVDQNGLPYQTIDTVLISFHTRPYGCTVTTPCGGGPYTMFNVTGYDLTWEDVSDRPGLETVDLPSWNVVGGSANVLVPIYETASAAFLVVGPGMKAMDWFRNLGQDPLPSSFEANLQIVFHGHESGSSKMTSFETTLRVLFLDSILEN
jgi:hypothetical protein